MQWVSRGRADKLKPYFLAPNASRVREQAARGISSSSRRSRRSSSGGGASSRSIPGLPALAAPSDNMGFAERVAEMLSRMVDKVRVGGGSRGAGSSSERVVRVARLPTRIYADGRAERGVSAEGLFGLVRLTVHEAELGTSSSSGSGSSSGGGSGASGDVAGAAATSAGTAAGGGGSSSSSLASAAAAVPSPADRGGGKCYAVVSVGQQTFSSRRVKRSMPTQPADPTAAQQHQQGSASSKRFEWHEGTDVVIQRGGASIAQVAIYRAGRVDGALGDKLQCWCQLDLASYFEGHPGAAVPPAHAEHPSPPPVLLMTAAQSGSEAALDAMHSSSSSIPKMADEREQPPQEQQQGAAAAMDGDGGDGAAAPICGDGSEVQGPPGLSEAAGAPAGGSEHEAAPPEPAEEPAQSLAREPSSGALSAAGSGDGEVLHASWLPLVDPGDASRVLGRVRITVRASRPEGLEQQLWRRLLGLADLNGDGSLCASEFEGLLEAMGSVLDAEEAAALFAQADCNADGRVDADELAAVLTVCHKDGELHRLMRRCPVDGAELAEGDDLANIIYVSLALDEGSGESLRGGYTTPEQVSRSWLLSMSEWLTQPLVGAPSALWKGNKYEAGGLRKGAAAAHILVFDRKTKRVMEEAVPPALTMAMRAIYQSRAGRLLLREGALKKLKQLTERQGRYADSPESRADIPKFLATFKGQVDMQEALEPDLSAYPTFNHFFYRKLRPEARPIAAPQDPNIIVSAADCRLMVFGSVDEATRCWIKGKKFSLAGLLADAEGAKAFEGGSMAVFRLAPQDYHRFHLPVGGRVQSITNVPGELMTVNPIAVNSPFADVFTRNKRSVLRLSSPGFGDVAYVAIGATIVGSILWSVEVGQELPKGAEAGYFAFGGSTIVVLFQAGAAAWDGDLVRNSLNSLETRVLMGERLGSLGSSAEDAPNASGAQQPSST